MAKLVNYRCAECGKNYEDILNDSEEKPETLEEKCECGGTYELFDVKNNAHRVRIFDANF